jgi:hypothetical protein
MAAANGPWNFSRDDRPLTTSPPAEKTAARQDQTGQSSTGDGKDTKRESRVEVIKAEIKTAR